VGLVWSTAAVDPHPASAYLAFASATELASELASGSTTSVDLVAGLLGRIDAVDRPGPPHSGPPHSDQLELRSLLALARDALDIAAARDAERRAGQVRGPLHGIPILVKDNIETVGLPGSAGSLALAGRPVARDAPVVATLRDAGAIVLGATNLSEWANIRSERSTSGWSALGGLTANPWSLGHSAGGSSSGSGAAIAAGLAPLALGTETDGSITCPASLNGCAGLKPTVGMLSRAGIVPVTHDQDSPGPLARNVVDLATMLDAMTATNRHAAVRAGHDPAFTVAAVARGWSSGHAATDDCFERVIERLGSAGMTVVDVEVADPAEVIEDEFAAILHALGDDLTGYLAARPGTGVRSLADVVDFNRSHAETELEHFGQDLFERALALGGRGAPGYTAARGRALHWARSCLDAALPPEGAGAVLLAPTYAPAWPADLAHGDPHDDLGGASTHAAAIAGWPILTIPMGFVTGLPVGLAVIGRPFTEPRLLAIGAAIEAVIGLAGTSASQPSWRSRNAPDSA